jgi:hypothetical protein
MKKAILSFTVCLDPDRGERLLERFPEQLSDGEKQPLLDHLELCPHCAEEMEFHEATAIALKKHAGLVGETWLDAFFRVAAKTREESRRSFQEGLREYAEIDSHQISLTIYCNGQPVGSVTISPASPEAQIEVRQEGQYEARDSKGNVFALTELTRKEILLPPGKLPSYRRAEGWRSDSEQATYYGSVLGGEVLVQLCPGIDHGILHISMQKQ